MMTNGNNNLFELENDIIDLSNIKEQLQGIVIPGRGSQSNNLLISVAWIVGVECSLIRVTLAVNNQVTVMNTGL